MITYSGAYCWPERGCPTLADIGRGLSRLPRFAGQTKEFYSVLSHVEVVAMLLPDELKLDGLLHDAPEAVVCDTPTTWKTDFHQASEGIILRRIYRELGCRLPTAAQKKKIKKADLRALHAEANIIGHGEPDWFPEPDEEAMEFTRNMLRNQIPVDEPERAEKHYIKLINLSHQVKQIKVG